MAIPGVQLKRVSKGYPDRGGGSRPVISGLNLEVARGEAAFLSGPSGSGKSTLLNLIAGLHLPDEGEVIVDGIAVHSLSETARDRLRAHKIGYVFQTFNLLSPLDLMENLLLPLTLSGREVDEPEARRVLEQLGLSDHLKKRPYELSVGQRQRVAVARAILGAPTVLLADEPTANLDQISAGAVVGAMARLVEGGAALVVATHDPKLREALSGRVLDVVSGEVLP